MRIGILGCGWAGEALRSKLSDEFDVTCIGRRNFKSFGHYDSLDVFVCATPPSETTLKMLAFTLPKLKAEGQVILLSSISCYKNREPVCKVEKTVRQKRETSVIIRLGGLMGYDRIAGRYTAGKRIGQNRMTNYIHRDDVVGFVCKLIYEDVEGGIFDLVAPRQSDLKSIYDANAERFGFAKTEFEDASVQKAMELPHNIAKMDIYLFGKPDVRFFWS